MKQMKRTPNLYKATNVIFDAMKCEAFSYRWWKFVARIDGVVIFNNYRYSPTTAKHQAKVRQLMRELNINIDIEAPFPQGIGNIFLDTAIVDAEENLCNEFLAQELKKQERNANAALRRKTKKLTQYLEETVHFRDYEIRPRGLFGSLNKVAVHQIVDDVEADVQNALHSFSRDGFSSVVFYV